ncbi:Cytochrome P450 CYP4 [Frankliniella occidentalis]|uniref:Cytochrome P450 4C1-like n=1 Tax=Frankliniella occidentalis TaxID=133901 RepID=A0A6J1T474_FRAOC|nr:cytochrome P450 4C1-like [Frankliniella occidentalis]KAE8748056.1 Cytochrome P450 CYP4 [Frankliniella occidentalis]
MESVLLVAVLVVLLISRWGRVMLGPYWWGPPAFRKAMDAFPGPRPTLPLLGNLVQLAFGGKVLHNGLAIIGRWSPSAFSFHLGPVPMVVLTRPEDYEAVIGKLTQKATYIYSTVESFFGVGLATLNGEAWRVHRKHITHAFHFRILERYVDVFERKGREFGDRVQRLADGATSFNVFPHLAFTANDTIFETAFGLDKSTNSAVSAAHRQEFVDAMEESFEQLQYRVLHPWLLMDWLYRLTPAGRRFYEAVDMIDGFAQSVIDDRRIKMRDGAAAGYSFLDLMMKIQPGEDAVVLNDAELRGELRTFISVQQTSATIMSFALILLAVHPDIQERVVDEAVAELGPEGGVTYASLTGLKYLERVLKETLRMYPVLPAMARDVTEDAQLTDGVVPAGASIAMVPIVTHRDPALWEEPTRFDPDRFLPERCTGRHPYSYLPFSAGPRNCVGQKYALLQMKAVMSTIVRRFEVLPGKGCGTMAELEKNLDVITFLTVSGGFNIRMRPRAPRIEPAACSPPPSFTDSVLRRDFGAGATLPAHASGR